MGEPRENDDYLPISILPVLSKVYEKLDLSQSNISSYRKCHSTSTTMLAIRDIIKAMKRGEITLAVMHMADFSKAFDTVDNSV